MNGSGTTSSTISYTTNRGMPLLITLSSHLAPDLQPAPKILVGVCLQVLAECADIPILGVCLGHQALGYVHGARVVHAPEPIHGRLSEIEHNGCELFSGIPTGRQSGFKVMRYHSLVIAADSLAGRELIPMAWTTSRHTLCLLDTDNNASSISSSPDEINKILMGVKHSSRPHYGVQFHPESIATGHRRQFFENFRRMTIDYWSSRSIIMLSNSKSSSSFIHDPPLKPFFNGKLPLPKKAITVRELKKDIHLKLQWKKIRCFASRAGGSENIFCSLFGAHNNAENTFWLDSSSTDNGRARFSFMGSKGGSLWKQLTFCLSHHRRGGGCMTIQDANGNVKTEHHEDGFFDFLDKELNSFHYDKRDYEGLPFNFYGGYVGYIGYDLKIECGATSNNHRSKAPDACFFFADNLVVIDHSNDDVYILQLHDLHRPKEAAWADEDLWLNQTEKKLLGLLRGTNNIPTTQLSMQRPEAGGSSSVQCFASTFVLDKSKHQYLKDVEKCLELIRDGESYELCLTAHARMRVAIRNTDALHLYLHLRRKNPAPYAAWLNFSREDLCICSSSPERFLRLDERGVLEAKPIKGTIARGMTPREDECLRLRLQYSEKNQAENLMIVDLLRNDLGRVCEAGTVCVPGLMEVESYATVHTLVSTIQGKKKSTTSAVEAIKAAFPGGSMTGAPKIRSMQLLDSIESSSRGVYSGSIGFISYNQTFDLNIVIRTVVLHKGEASVGAGGAIIALSEPEDEYQEMMLKAKVPTKVVQDCSRCLDYV
ncbi:hypothetical protein KSP39_PZI004929 [Platanthera zijinensis]|uniref:aminodeoxychorismate synthase n=1 Tax=Platanthera zijinensis TaxID=2320716 RepID=A0AAP0BVB1_9ASPA